MTSIPTAPSRPAATPQPIPPQPIPQQPTEPRSTEPRSTAQHEHGWRVQSVHRTSQGRVLYVRCDCGVRRVDLQTADAAPPTALSRTVGG